MCSTQRLGRSNSPVATFLCKSSGYRRIAPHLRPQPGILQIQLSAELFVERDKSYAAKFKETGKELLYPREFRNFEGLCLAAEDISLTRDFARGGETTDPEFVLAAGGKHYQPVLNIAKN